MTEKTNLFVLDLKIVPSSALAHTRDFINNYLNKRNYSLRKFKYVFIKFMATCKDLFPGDINRFAFSYVI